MQENIKCCMYSGVSVFAEFKANAVVITQVAREIVASMSGEFLLNGNFKINKILFNEECIEIHGREVAQTRSAVDIDIFFEKLYKDFRLSGIYRIEANGYDKDIMDVEFKKGFAIT